MEEWRSVAESMVKLRWNEGERSQEMRRGRAEWRTSRAMDYEPLRLNTKRQRGRRAVEGEREKKRGDGEGEGERERWSCVNDSNVYSVPETKATSRFSLCGSLSKHFRIGASCFPFIMHTPSLSPGTHTNNNPF